MIEKLPLLKMFDDSKIEAIRSEFHMPEHIRDHCNQVAKVANFLAAKIESNGREVETGIVHAAAMLHDLLRVCDIKNWNPDQFSQKVTKQDLETWSQIRSQYKGVHHADAAADLFEKFSEQKIADCIRKHFFLRIIDEDLCPSSLEEKIVFYSDKRVAHTKIVSLADRFAEGASRHTDNSPEKQSSVEEAIAETFNLEKELLELANIREEDINDL